MVIVINKQKSTVQFYLLFKLYYCHKLNASCLQDEVDSLEVRRVANAGLQHYRQA